MKYILSLFLSAIFLLSCGEKRQSNSTEAISKGYDVEYAQGFQVIKTDGYTHITVRNPWDTANLLQSYILVDKKKELPENLPTGVIIKIPVSTAVATSVIQSTTLKELNSLNIITGVCEPQYINIDYIKQGIKNNKIVDLGMASNPSTEAIILLSPDVIFSDPVTGQSQSNIEKTRIPIIQTPDYTEPHPLGRAEWIRFYSLFVGQEALADSLFAITSSNYNNIKAMVDAVEQHPTVFTDTRYQGSWNMAGGKSYMANLLADAGGDYLWSDNDSHTFMPLSFEAVLDKAGESDTWIIRYYADKDMTYKSLENEYKPYSYFKAFKEKKVFGCNTMHSKYYEDLPIHPDYILKDLANVFHPELFPNYQAKYYKKLEE